MEYAAILACKQCETPLIQVSSFLAVCHECEMIYALVNGYSYGVTLETINQHIEHELNPPRVVFRLKDEFVKERKKLPVVVHDVRAVLDALK